MVKLIYGQRSRTLSLQDDISQGIDALLNLLGKLGDRNEFASIVVWLLSSTQSVFMHSRLIDPTSNHAKLLRSLIIPHIESQSLQSIAHVVQFGGQIAEGNVHNVHEFLGISENSINLMWELIARYDVSLSRLVTCCRLCRLRTRIDRARQRTAEERGGCSDEGSRPHIVEVG